MPYEIAKMTDFYRDEGYDKYDLKAYELSIDLLRLYFFGDDQCKKMISDIIRFDDIPDEICRSVYISYQAYLIDENVKYKDNLLCFASYLTLSKEKEFDIIKAMCSEHINLCPIYCKDILEQIFLFNLEQQKYKYFCRIKMLKEIIAQNKMN